MIDVPWKIFSQTGDIEAYLLMKEIEESFELHENKDHEDELEDTHL